jgi:hypothetical protein
MITLVSSTLAVRRVGRSPVKTVAQRRRVQQVALAGAHEQPDIGHQQQVENLD